MCCLEGNVYLGPPEKLRPDNEMLSEARKLVHRNYYYNIVSYIHIPLVPQMQGRSEAERRAIWPCLNVATWRKKRSDVNRAIQQIC